MTFLQLCQRLRQETGISGVGPSAVTGQVGELKKIVDWTLSAYEDIQNLHASWKFLQTSFTFPTIAATQNYTPEAVSLSDLATWKTSEETDLTIYSSTSDEQYLLYVPWNNFKSVYMFGSNRIQTLRPTIATIKPDNSMSLWAIPNDVYTVTGEYYKKAQTMTLTTDEPLIPSQYHLIIVWRALMYYGAFVAADEKYSHGQNEYMRILKRLEFSQLPRIGWGEPLV